MYGGISAVRVTGLSLACGDVEIIKRRLETGNIFNIFFETVMEGVLFEQLIKGKGKRKNPFLHAMKTYGGNGGIAPLILNLGPRWSLAVGCTSRGERERESLRYIRREAGRFFRDRLDVSEKRKILYSCWVLNPGARWRSGLWHCATCRSVAGSIPDGIIGIFH